MIARRITYKGNFNQEAVGLIYNIVRNHEMTGQIQMVNEHEVVLNLEGDPSFIKLIQHQIERRAKSYITGKDVAQIPYQRYVGVTLLA